MRMQLGSALAETALVVGLALLVLFNALELSLLGFYQMHADAAAFLTARVQSLSDAATAQATLVSALPPALPAAPTLSTPGGQSQSIASHTWQGLLLLPGMSGSSTVSGEHIEPTASQASVQASFAFDAPPATLPNYYPQSDVNDAIFPFGTAYSIVYIAQNLGTTPGNGFNGQFNEWRDHQKCFAAVPFPQQYSATQTSSTPTGYTVDVKTNPWANFPNGSVEDTIYGWDKNPGGTC